MLDRALAENETALTTASPTAVAEIESWAEFGPVDDGTQDEAVIFPVIKIVQPTSSMKDAGKHGGDWYHSDKEDYEIGLLNVVALHQRETRALFIENNDQPQCFSLDGQKPFNMYQPIWSNTEELNKLGAQPVASGSPETCAQCPLSQWADDSPPPCSGSIVLIVDRAGEGEPYDLAQLRISGKSIKPWRRFVRSKLRPKNLPLVSVRLLLSTAEHSEPGKKWYQLEIESEPRTPFEAREHVALMREMRQWFDQAAAAAMDDPDSRRPANTSGAGWGDGTESYAGRNADVSGTGQTFVFEE